MYGDKKAQEELIKKGAALYEEHRQELEARHDGEVVAIDVDSGQYVLGRTLGAANDAIYPRHPDRWIYFVRIGTPGAALALRTW